MFCIHFRIEFHNNNILAIIDFSLTSFGRIFKGFLLG